MNTPKDPASQALEKAHQAINQGELVEARQWAEKAAELAPKREEPWLILAGSSDPPEAITYLKRALEINPGSQRARKGIHWAVQRMRKNNSRNGGRDPQVDPSASQEANDLYERWNLIFHYWKLIVVITLIAGLVGWGASYIKSPVYESTATVMIRSQRVFGAQGGVAAQFNAQEAKVLGEAMVSFFRSRPIAERVVQTLHLDEEKPITDPIKRLRHDLREFLGKVKDFALHGYVLKADPYEAAIETYRKNIVAAPLFQSSLLIIQAEASEPETAAAIANASVSTFIEYANSIYGTETDERLTYLEQQLEDAKAKQEQARLNLLSFQQASHMPEMEEEIKARLAHVLQLEQDLQSTDGKIESLKIQLDMIRAQIENESSTLETRREGTSDTNQSARVNSGSGSTTEKRSAKTTSSDTIIETNQLYQSLRGEQLQMERSFSDLQDRRDLLQEAIDSNRKHLDDLSAIASTYKQLDQEFIWASNVYDNLRLQHETMLLNKAFPIEEVRQIDVAMPPLYPVRPLRILYLGVGAVLGLFGGMLLVIVRNFWQRRKASSLPIPQN